MRSPTCSPAASAGDPGASPPTTTGVVVERRKLRALQQDEGHDDDRQGEVHHRAHHEHLEPLPLRLGQELVGGPRAGIFRGLAGHLDVAAERNRADAVFRVAAPEGQDLRPEAQREREDAHPNPPRHHEMAELVDENQYPEYKKESENAGHTLDFTLPANRAATFDWAQVALSAPEGERPRPFINGPHIVQAGNRGRTVLFVGVHRLPR